MRAAALIIALALVPRVGHLVLTWNEPVGGDAVEYDDLGWKVARGLPYTAGSAGWTALRYNPPDQPTALRSPGLPVFAAAHYVLFGHRPVLVRLSLALLGALAAGALFAAVRRRWGLRVALIAGLAWALWPQAYLSYFGSDAFLAESLAVPLVLFALWLDGLEARWAPLLTGVVLGGALVTRGYLLPALLLWVGACVVLLRRPAVWRRMAIILTVALLPTLAWSYRNYRAFHTFVLQSTQQGTVLFVGNYSGARGAWNGAWLSGPEFADLLARRPEVLTVDEAAKSRIYQQEAIAAVRRGGVKHFFWLEARKLALFFYPREVGYGWQYGYVLTLLFLPFGFWALRRQLFDEGTLLVLSLIAGALAVTVIMYFETRFRSCADPAMVIVASLGADYWIARLRRSSS